MRIDIISKIIDLSIRQVLHKSKMKLNYYYEYDKLIMYFFNRRHKLKKFNDISKIKSNFQNNNTLILSYHYK